MKTFLLTLSLAALLCSSACTPHTTEATEVGVRFNKITGATEVAQPGATYFFTPIINDWTKFDVSTQNLLMTAKVRAGDRNQKDDLRFKTRDGNDIRLTVPITLKEAVLGAKVKVPAGEFDAVVIQPIIKTKGIFSQEGEAQVWLSDDKSRIIAAFDAPAISNATLPETPTTMRATLECVNVEGMKSMSVATPSSVVKVVSRMSVPS